MLVTLGVCKASDRHAGDGATIEAACGYQGPVESGHAVAMVIQRGLHRTLNKMFHVSP